jgi:TDG/mug DNA glycosylase family protein
MNAEHRPPTPTEIQAAAGKTVPDVISEDLRLLIVGINPGLYTAAIGHHFGRPGNRFWPAIYLAGITPRLLSPYEERELLEYGVGITNIVDRATAVADELTREELIEGGKLLEDKVRRYRPQKVAVLGVTAYRSGFQRPKAALGLQPEKLAGAELWVLPNPSGLNAHYDLDRLATSYREAYTGSV